VVGGLGVSGAPAASAVTTRPNGVDASDDIQIELDDGAAPPRPSAIEIGDDGLADAEAALEAMQSFRLAEAALQRNDTAKALSLAQKAVAGDPTQADYVTLVAWIQSLGGNPAAVEGAIATMTRVLGDDPSNERALLYRGKLFARSNRPHEALADFNELLGGNPHHREAANELRTLKSKMP
jgi:Flp pilus assembly protein TadD